MTLETDLRRVADLADAAAAMAAEGQRAGLALLLAEMQALTSLLPGIAVPVADDAKRREEQAAVEASFDNMPV